MDSFEQLELFADTPKDISDRENLIKNSLVHLNGDLKSNRIYNTIKKSITKYGFDKNFANFLKRPLPVTDKEELEVNEKDDNDFEEFYEKQVIKLTTNNFENEHKLMQVKPTRKFAYSLLILNNLSAKLGQRRISYMLTYNPEDIVDIVSYLNGDFFSILDKSELDSINNNLKDSIPIKTPEKIIKIRSNLELIEKRITFDEFCTEINSSRKVTVLSNFSKAYKSSNGFMEVKFSAKGKHLYPPKGFPNKVVDGKPLNIKEGSSSYIFVNPKNFNKEVLVEYINNNTGRTYIVLIAGENSYIEKFRGLGATDVLFMANRNYSENIDSLLENLQQI